ncbi:MAG: hypothetical protein JWP40_3763 [Blastococcus sp.]|nr:hypothetical protein [Blastococcus sp.]
MPERVYHLSKAAYNVEVAKHLREDTGYIDWAVTATFYAALHIVDSMLDGLAHLPKDERHPRKHSANGNDGNGGRGRNQLVAAEFPAIRKAYRSLEEASRRARYDLQMLDPAAYERLQDQFQEIVRYEALMAKTQPGKS